ncbi:MAG: MMPL family transporter [Bacteroidia bacterium]|nr:MMPL family transporter [Bacteroidia bacterium]MDW8347238.1 MMPL family transporter [Bacteroidia bacterium]
MHLDKKFYFFERHHYLIIATFVVLLCISIYGMTFLRFNYKFDTFFPQGDANLDFYQKYKQQYGPDDNVVSIAIENDGKTIWDAHFLSLCDTIAQQCKKLPHVEQVFCLTQAQLIERGVLGYQPVSALPYQNIKNFAPYRERLKNELFIKNTLISNDEKSIAIRLVYDPKIIDSKEKDILDAQIHDILEKNKVKHFWITGVPHIRTQYVATVQREMAIFMTASILITIIVLIFTFYSFWGVFIPLICVVLALFATLGLIGFTTRDLGVMTNLIPVIMFMVGVSDSIHIISHYKEYLSQGYSKKDAIAHAIKAIGVSTFITGITTSIGFASLAVSNMMPIREFGLFTAFGVMMAWLNALVLTPCILYLIPPMKPSHWEEKQQDWKPFIRKIIHVTDKYPIRVVAAFGIVGAVALYGTNIIKQNAFLLDDISNEHRIKQELRYFEQHYQGLRPVEIAITAKGKENFNSPIFLAVLDTFQTFIENKIQSQVISPVTLQKYVHQIMEYGDSSAYYIPQTRNEVKKIYKLAARAGSQNPFKFCLIDSVHGRMSAKMKDIGMMEVARINQEIEDFYRNRIDTTLFSYKQTGSAILVDQNNQYLIGNLFTSLLLSTGAVAVLMGFLFGSWRVVLITFIPNVFPLLVAGAWMGFAGINLKASTSIIFSIAFGIAVDDTIHVLARYRIERKRGLSNIDAVNTTMLSTGRAIIIASVVLILGFSVLIYSDFGGTYYTGLFMVVTIISAILAELFLTPLLLKKLLN